MRIDQNGWLTGVYRCPSPNCDARSDEQGISLLVIHAISLPPLQFGGPYVRQLFCNRLNPAEHEYFESIHELRVSAHLFVRRNGRVIQFVPLHKRAWHAGVSSFDGREGCNDFSIGIELEGSDEQRFTQAQYRQLKRLTALIQSRWPQIGTEQVVGHCDIAPGRKTDPGPYFNWPRYRASLARQ